MEEFLSDEIDFVIEEVLEEDIELTEQQRKEIIDNLTYHYDYVWEQLNDAIQNEIEKILEQEVQKMNALQKFLVNYIEMYAYDYNLTKEQVKQMATDIEADDYIYEVVEQAIGDWLDEHNIEIG